MLLLTFSYLALFPPAFFFLFLLTAVLLNLHLLLIQEHSELLSCFLLPLNYAYLIFPQLFSLVIFASCLYATPSTPLTPAHPRHYHYHVLHILHHSYPHLAATTRVAPPHRISKRVRVTRAAACGRRHATLAACGLSQPGETVTCLCKRQGARRWRLPRGVRAFLSPGLHPIFFLSYFLLLSSLLCLGTLLSLVFISFFPLLLFPSVSWIRVSYRGTFPSLRFHPILSFLPVLC